MTSDLESRLARYRDELDAAIDARTTPRRAAASSHRGRGVALVGALAVAAAAVAVVLVVRSGPDGTTAPTADTDASTTATGPDGTTPSTEPSAVADWSGLDDFGAEAPQPPVPDGWKVLEFATYRFAVPGDWTVPNSASCAAPAPGIVVVPSVMSGTCEPAAPPAASSVTFTKRSGPVLDGVRRSVGTLEATELPGDHCAGCASVYQFDDGYDVALVGEHSGDVLATFTDAGARRVLQEGDVLDTTGWQPVSFGGVALLVPPSWNVVDLPSTLFTTTDAVGNVTGGGGMADPGTCNLSLFGGVDGPTAFTGRSNLVVGCPASTELRIVPHDGVWLRDDDGSTDQLRTLQIGTIGTVGVWVADTSSLRLGLTAPPLDLRVVTATDTVLVSLGVGLDAATARTVLRSIHGS